MLQHQYTTAHAAHAHARICHVALIGRERAWLTLTEVEDHVSREVTWRFMTDAGNWGMLKIDRRSMGGNID